MPLYIVSAADDRYARHLGVMLSSVFANKFAATHIEVFVIDGGISDANKKKLARLSREYGFVLSYLAIDKTLFEGLHVSRFMEHASRTTFYRVALPGLLPRDINKVLYLDCDLVVRKDLSILWNTDIAGRYLAAVPNARSQEEAKRLFSLPKPGGYFNAGVMLINVARWRENDVTRKIMAYLRENDSKTEFSDQDGINAITVGNYVPLPLTFNVMYHYLDAVKDPSIIHFSGAGKPWISGSGHPYKELYHQYLDKSPWRSPIPRWLSYVSLKRSILKDRPRLHETLRKIKYFVRAKD